LKASIQDQEALIQVKVSNGKELELNFYVKVKGIKDLHLINSHVVDKPKDEEKVRKELI
jgi:hypothetical protein